MIDVIEAMKRVDVRYCPLVESYVACTQECGGEGGKPGPCPQNKPDEPSGGSGGSNKDAGKPASPDKPAKPKTKVSQKVKDLASAVTAKSKKAGKVVADLVKGGAKLKRRVKEKADEAVMMVADYAAKKGNQAAGVVGKTPNLSGGGILTAMNAAIIDMVVKFSENDAMNQTMQAQLGVGAGVIKGAVMAMYHTSNFLAKQIRKVEDGAVDLVKKGAEKIRSMGRKDYDEARRVWAREEDDDPAAFVADQLYAILSDATDGGHADLIDRDEIEQLVRTHLEGGGEE